MQTEAEQIWEQSERYVEMARESLNPKLLRPRGSGSVLEEIERLRIVFLFPTLTEKSKKDLLTVRQYFLIAREHQEQERADRNKCAEYSEAMADQVGHELKEALP